MSVNTQPLDPALTSWRPSWLSLSHLNLRPKLVLAFVTVAAMAGLCGVVGLVFVNRITTTVSGLTDVTSPLIAESLALVENAQHTRSVFFASIERHEDAGQLSRQLSELRSDSHVHIQRLKTLASRTRTNLQLELVERQELAFATTIAAMTEASARERSATAIAQVRLAAFESSYHTLRQALISLADRADGSMSKAEDEAKVQVQTRAATVDGLGDKISEILNGTYPIVQNLNKLLRELEQIDDSVRLLMQAAPDQIQSLEEKFKNSFRKVGSMSRALRSRIPDVNYDPQLATLTREFREIEKTILSNGGLLQSQREAIEARTDIAVGRRSFDMIEHDYFNVLDNVQEAVRELNRQAETATSTVFSRARTITTIGILFTLAVATLFSLLFAHRLTKPLIGLASQVSEIRASGELKSLPDKSVAGRHDEIGTLSRNFNLMMIDLADAREQLIKWSDAEVSKQLERLELAINSMPQGLCMFDADQNLIVSNKPYAAIYGLKPEQITPGTSLRVILGNRESTLNPVDSASSVLEEQIEAVENHNPWSYVRELNDGRAIAISHLPMPGGGSIATHEDITPRRKTEAKIAYMAHHDMLTGLPNRVQFRDDMEKTIRSMRDQSAAILCLDLDHFKSVNDTLGHPVGDALLVAVAKRLRSCLRPTDKVARLGGDEFAVIQIDVDQPVGSTALATRINKELSEPFTVADHQMVIGASIGIALAPTDGINPDHLLRSADMALYRAKEVGRGTFRYFEQEMDARMHARRTLELDLRKALAMGEFELYYQPLINMESGAVATCEALLRWNHPERGLVSPNEFIPLAEEIGLITPIGAWVLKKACVEAERWPKDIKLAVNLSPVQFKGDTLVLDVISALNVSGLLPNRLELEITEAVLLNDTDATLSTLNQLRDLGVHISMDDFGTGYSSLGYLRKFPFDKIKIDQSFIRELSDQPESIAIVRAVTGLANTLGITTTAEGVETADQLQRIKNEGCTEAQGFLFSKPIAAEAILRLLQRPGADVAAVA